MSKSRPAPPTWPGVLLAGPPGKITGLPAILTFGHAQDHALGVRHHRGAELVDA